jgi:hypothetical protein
MKYRNYYETNRRSKKWNDTYKNQEGSNAHFLNEKILKISPYSGFGTPIVASVRSSNKIKKKPKRAYIPAIGHLTHTTATAWDL